MSRINFKLRLPALVTAIAACVLMASAAGAQAAPIGAYTTKGAWNFVSAPNLHPPILGTTQKTQFSKLASGYFMTANFKNLGYNQPMTGQSGPLDPRPQPPAGVVRPDRRERARRATSRCSSYQRQAGAQLVAGSGHRVRRHHAAARTSSSTSITGTSPRSRERTAGSSPSTRCSSAGQNAWVTAYKNVPMNLTRLRRLGQRRGARLGGPGVQPRERPAALSPGTRSTRAVPLTSRCRSQSRRRSPGIPWDAYHINAIQLTGNETFLVSLRNTWSAYLVNRLTNAIEWTLSGNPKLSTFALPEQRRVPMAARRRDAQPATWSACSTTRAAASTDHEQEREVRQAQRSDARPRAEAQSDQPHRQLRRPVPARQATSTPPSSATRSCSPAGTSTLGWGSQPFFSEDSSKGKVLLDAFWPTPDRATACTSKSWVGTPYFPPSGAVRNNGGKATVYASWDGDTQVVGWRVLAGSSAQSLKSVATKAKSGFETTIPLSSTSQGIRGAGTRPQGEGARHVQGVPDAELQQRAARRVLAAAWGHAGRAGGARPLSGRGRGSHGCRAQRGP